MFSASCADQERSCRQHILSTCWMSVSFIKQVCLQLCHVVQQPAQPTAPALQLMRSAYPATCWWLLSAESCSHAACVAKLSVV